MSQYLESLARWEGGMQETASAMRCDLHVHSIRSGSASAALLALFGNECYSEPAEVYEVARRRGMDLFTLTDHDTIEGALALAHRPDCFVSEEVTCDLPGGRQVHVGVYDISPVQHAAIARRRRDAEALFAYLAEQRIAASFNHPFSALTGRRASDDLRLCLDRLALVETRNGMMPAITNDLARRAGRATRRAALGGSDAHTLASVARAYTLVRGARTRAEYLEGLRQGMTIPMGRSGSYARFTGDVARVFAAAYRDNARHGLDSLSSVARLAAMLAALPILPLLPLVTAILYGNERLFGLRHYSGFAAMLKASAEAQAVPDRLRPAPAASLPVAS